MKKTILTVVSGVIIGAVIAGFGFLGGVVYGVEGTSKIACEGLCATIGELDINEQSDELVLSGERYGECEGFKFVITRTE